MDRRTAEKFKQRLLKMKHQLQELQKGIQSGGLRKPFPDSISEISLYDNHPGDIASESFERSKDLALDDSTNNRLRKIDDALQAIEDGTYGICDICGKPIDIDRLEVMPETTQCVNCRQDEETIDRHLRPIEEDVVRPLFGDRNEDNEFDGEDTWQKVANWNEHAEESGAGAYYGSDTNLDESGSVDILDNIPYFQGADGIHYRDFKGKDDEDAPKEKQEGKKGADKIIH